MDKAIIKLCEALVIALTARYPIPDKSTADLLAALDQFASAKARQRAPEAYDAIERRRDHQDAAVIRRVD